MSAFTPKDTSRTGSPDWSPAVADLILKPSKIIRNGQVVWLYSKAN
jgi:hypothetical protein